MDIMLEAVVLCALGLSTGPEILIFKRLKNAWKRTDFKTAASDACTLHEVKNITN
jgi:hypothetical protein